MHELPKWYELPPNSLLTWYRVPNTKHYRLSDSKVWPCEAIVYRYNTHAYHAYVIHGTDVDDMYTIGPKITSDLKKAISWAENFIIEGEDSREE